MGGLEEHQNVFPIDGAPCLKALKQNPKANAYVMNLTPDKFLQHLVKDPAYSVFLPGLAGYAQFKFEKDHPDCVKRKELEQLENDIQYLKSKKPSSRGRKTKAAGRFAIQTADQSCKSKDSSFLTEDEEI